MKLPPAHIGVAVMIGAGFALLTLSTDLFLASLPGIRAYFDVTVSQAQLTLSVFLAGFAFSQLVRERSRGSGSAAMPVRRPRR